MAKRLIGTKHLGLVFSLMPVAKGYWCRSFTLLLLYRAGCCFNPIDALNNHPQRPNTAFQVSNESSPLFVSDCHGAPKNVMPPLGDLQNQAGRSLEVVPRERKHPNALSTPTPRAQVPSCQFIISACDQ